MAKRLKIKLLKKSFVFVIIINIPKSYYSKILQILLLIILIKLLLETCATKTNSLLTNSIYNIIDIIVTKKKKLIN